MGPINSAYDKTTHDPTPAGASAGASAGLRLRDLDALPVSRLNGVGEKKTKALATAEIHTVLDLVTRYPRRYLDRTRERRISDMVEGEEAMALVTVVRSMSRRVKGGRVMVNVIVTDGASNLELTFFNQAWRERQLSEGKEAIVFGKITFFRGKRQMANPVVDLVGDKTGRIIPIYPQSEKTGLNTWDLAEFVAEALRRTLPPSGRGLVDPLPDEILDRFDFVDRGAALSGIHAPESMAEASAARRRLVFDELFRMQLALVMRKRHLEATEVGLEHVVEGPLVRRFRERLPFPLTGAQQRAITEISADLRRAVPMHRLLQGDVGSGKTLVAVASMLAAVDGGHQAALMAPTEVLAEQHFSGIRGLLDGLTVEDSGNLLGSRPVSVELLTNRTTAADRKRVLNQLVVGQVDIIVGTHSLIQDTVRFYSLGAVVIDEQHRFGVEQRAALRDKSAEGVLPDVLVMTATPIPRTAAMTVYGDLDVSVLDELPPGRTPIVTRWVKAPNDKAMSDRAMSDKDEAATEADAERFELEWAELWREVRSEVADGRQVYVVTPLIEESEKMEVASAEAMFDQLSIDELAGLNVGLLHGRLPPADRDATMEAFRAGRLDALVATTVIEVGVDVPNATVMVILDADRFGIAQLHQLRGRVGRGQHASTCWLVGPGLTSDGEARLQALVDSTDGFELAEIDLDLRGEGTILGERQKGKNDLKLASLRRDREVVASARAAAIDLLDRDPGLARHPDLLDELLLLFDGAETEWLMKG